MKQAPALREVNTVNTVLCKFAASINFHDVEVRIYAFIQACLRCYANRLGTLVDNIVSTCIILSQ